jgi:lambda family phage portal protein
MGRAARATIAKPAGHEWTRGGILVPGDVKASYDAAQTVKNNKRHWSAADSLSADAANTLAVRRKLRDRARYEYANNCYIHGIINSLAYDTIGSGPVLQIFSDNSVFRDAVERAYSAWAASINLAQSLRIFVESRVRDGEVFGIFTTNPRALDDVKLFFELVECDRVTSDAMLSGMAYATDGITVDQFGNPVEYQVLKSHPGAAGITYLREFERIRADHMVHYYNPSRPGQHRGISEITPALELCIVLRRYTMAVVTAAETAADNAFVLETMNAQDTEYDPSNELEELTLERNLVTVLPEGYKLSQTKAEQPTTTYPAFKDAILNEIARSLGVPFNIAAGNSSSYNYSSGRLDHKAYEQRLSVDQATLEQVLLNRMFDRFFAEWSAVNGMLGAPAPSRAWYWQKLPHIDPVKEADAQIMRINAGLTTRTREVARDRVDYEDLLKDMQREKQLEEQYGIQIAEPTPPAGGPEPSVQEGEA